MGTIVQQDPNTANRARLTAERNAALSTPMPTLQPGLDPSRIGVFDSAIEFYMHETMIGDMMRYGIAPDDKNPDAYNYDARSTFNPYKFFIDNEEEFGYGEEWVRSGLFKNVYGEDQFRDKMDRLSLEQENRKYIQNSNIVGSLVGGVLSFADISTLIPYVNVYKKGVTASRIINYGLNAGIYSVAQEAMLQTRQDLRTMDESTINIAGGFVIGGTFGAVAAGFNKQSFLHPKHPNNPFKASNPVFMGIGRIGQSMADNVVIKPVIKGGQQTFEAVAETTVGRSVGAAAREATTLAKAGATTAQGPARAVVKGIGKVGEKVITHTVGKAIPLIRGITDKVSPAMVKITTQLYDLGGIQTQAMKRGEATRSVEDDITSITAIFDMAVFPEAGIAFHNLAIGLARLSGKNTSELGQAASNVGTRVKQFAGDVAAGPSMSGRRGDEVLPEGRLNEIEFTDITYKAAFDDLDGDTMANLVSRFGDEGADMIIAAAKKQAELIHAFNKEIFELMKKHDMVTDADAIDGYTLAQLWQAKGIRNNKADAKRFFLDLFAGTPTEKYLDDNFGFTEDQFNALGKSEVTLKGLDGTPRTVSVEEGLGIKVEILEDWAGDISNAAENAARRDLDQATEAEKSARTAAVLAARDLRTNVTDIKKATVDEVVNIIKTRAAQREKLRAEHEKLKLEKQRNETELKEAEAEMLARGEQYHDTAPAKRRKERVASGEVKEAEALLHMADEGGVATSKADTDFARENLTKADAEMAKAGDDALEEAVEKAAKIPVSNSRLATLRERINQINKRMNKIERSAKRLDDKLTAAQRAVDEAKAAKQQIVDARKFLNKAAKEASKDARAAKRQLKKYKKAVKREENKPPIDVYVDELVTKLSNNERSPFGGLDGEFFQSGRAKRRQIHMTNAQRREAVRLGFLRNDLYGVMHQSVNDLAPRIALRRIFGNGTEEQIVRRLQQAVEDDYNVQISKATGAAQQRLKNKLERQKMDIERGVLRLMGRYGIPKDPESVLAWAGRSARGYNFIRYGSGFLIPSMTDLSNVLFTSGWGVFAGKNMRAVRRSVAGLKSQEIRRLAAMSERVQHSSTVMKMANIDDVQAQAGIGSHGTVKHYTTSTIDRINGGLTEATSISSGMMWWNSRLKMLSMMEMQHNFVKLAKDYDALLSAASAGNKGAENKIAQLASLGIGVDEMRLIQKMMAKHEPQLDEGVFELGMGRWLEEGADGQRAYQAILTALDHTATRSIMTPGKGDTPFLISNGFGKLLLQFQTYGFVSMSKYLLPAFQRMANYGDMQAFLTLNLQVALGTAVVASKDFLRNGEIKDRTQAQWAYDIIDRSGLLLYLSTPLASATSMFGNEASRYSKERNRLALLFGPTGGLITDAWDMADATAQGDTDRMGTVGQKLLPFKLYQQLATVALGE